MEIPVTDCAATALATHVDRALAPRWAETGATLAVAQSGGPGSLAVTLTPLADRPSEGLRKVPAAACVAACIAGYGNAVRLDIPSKVRVPVLVTLAVACCRNVILLRHEEGRVDRRLRAEGALIDLLRGWADLGLCPGCRGASPAAHRPDVPRQGALGPLQVAEAAAARSGVGTGRPS